MNTKEQIETLLKNTFTIARMELLDESAKHAGHQGQKETGGGHFFVLIVSDDFEGQSLVSRHRMVYGAVNSIKNQIHALGITAKTIDEFEQSGS